MSEPRTIYVDTREGPAPVTLPADVAAPLAALAGSDEEMVERVFEAAGLVLLRAGAEAGSVLLRHWLAHAPELLMEADPAFAHALAQAPEAIVGPLAGTAAAQAM